MSGNDDCEILRVTRRLISKFRPTKFPRLAAIPQVSDCDEHF